MRFIFAMISLGMVLALPAETKAQSWEEYRPDGVGFRIEMPGKPKLETRTTQGGRSAFHAVVAFRNMGFLVIHGARGDTLRAGVTLETGLDDVVKAFAGDKKVLRSTKEMIGGYPARRVLVEDADEDQMEVRMVIADNRLIQAIFIGPSGNAVGRRFLESLAIVEPKPPQVAADWGAIAIDVADTELPYGIGGGDSESKAVANAMRFCRQSGGKACKLVVTYNECAAYAASRAGGAPGRGATKKAAEAQALAACKDRCWIVVSDCN